MEKMVNELEKFSGIYKGKRVLVTGHTGFKGSWLSLWLKELGAKVAGFSKYLPSDPCNFEVINLKGKICHNEGDIRNFDELKNVFESFQPQIVFHLAAQPIVRYSYSEPKVTFDTNLGGTVNILECIRNTKDIEAAVIITSDKCYRNIGQEEGYHEEDRLGGDDPYSASKACAELACQSYFKSYFASKDSVKIATTRAGNVIGGGDWAKDRIVPDCIKSWQQNEVAIIRKPEATRPWQHVLEPLSGYLWLGASLIQKPNGITCEAFNFGPNSDETKSVKDLVELMLGCCGKGEWKHVAASEQKKEATLLQLSCEKALQKLSWKPVLHFKETVEFTADWYKKFYSGNKNMYDFSVSQINSYTQKAIEQNSIWIGAK